MRSLIRRLSPPGDDCSYLEIPTEMLEALGWVVGDHISLTVENVFGPRIVLTRLDPVLLFPDREPAEPNGSEVEV